VTAKLIWSCKWKRMFEWDSYFSFWMEKWTCWFTQQNSEVENWIIFDSWYSKLSASYLSCIFTIYEYTFKTNIFISIKKVMTLFFFIHLFICAYIVWGLSPPYPCPLCLPSPSHASKSFLQFCWRADISNNKKGIAFLLVEIRVAIQTDS
jgi:hypothetical protein